jgi:hypothetical protein
VAGSTGARDAQQRASAERLGAAWLRRDSDALDHLFAYCTLSSVAMPALGVPPAAVLGLAHEALAAMRTQLDGDHDAAIADGVLAVGLYFHALLGWELTDDFEEISQFVDGALAALSPLAAESTFRSVVAARQMLESVPYQCRTEEARLCACSYSMELSAKAAVEYLDQITIAERGVHDVDDVLLGLVRRDAHHTAAFYAALATVVAPLAGRFAEALVDTTPAPAGAALSPVRAELQADIRAALPDLRRLATEMASAGEVLGGELAVQVDALARMADALEVPSLALDHGQLIYVYPFTLEHPSGDGGIRLGECTLRLGDADVPFRVREVHRTDAWRFLAEGTSEVFTAFRDRGELVLADGYELRFRPKWIEMEEERGAEPGADHHAFGVRVVLGSHGGHYVHLETHIAERAGADGPDPWSGAHVDQWVRRLSRDAGADRVSLHSDGVLVAEWGTLHELAEAIVTAIDLVEHPPSDDAPGDASHPAPDLVGESVIFQIDAARVIEPDGTARPLRAGDRIEHMTGYTALMAAARYLPASVEEWIRLDAPPPQNHLEGLRPEGDVLLISGDVMTLLPLGSPNWVVMEQLEILEFAISLRGYLEHLGDRLRRRLRSEEATGRPPTIDQVADDIALGNRVLELLRSRDLMRSRYHSELLARIFPAIGAADLDARVDKTIDALRDVRRELEEEERNHQAEVLNLTLFWLTVVTVFIAVYQFVASFFADDVGTVVQLLVAAISGVVTAAVAVGYRHRRHRRARDRAAAT